MPCGEVAIAWLTLRFSSDTCKSLDNFKPTEHGRHNSDKPGRGDVA